jgi:formylglycine-generating enzyme required for sulfatase activity
MLYGPSGCGKTSLVKAGLLPRLAEHVIPVYVEATADDTVLRLLKRLRKVCPESEADVSLPEFLGFVREGRWLPRGKKVLLVVDQFEQWLHGQRGGQDTQLVEAIRQCDGARVQCLLLVRDDFWSATSRFMRDLEIRPVDGENLAFVDRFDLLHARRVLAALGQAYGRLPAEWAGLTDEQSQFLERVVADLAQDGKVVCVRLALFADMMRGRPWTTSNLRQVGGAEGLGVTFLEEMFGAATARAEYRCHQTTARAILQALLPETATDIKGGMRSYAELLEAANSSNRAADFDDVVRMLDSELRLITPTDPEARDAGASVSAEDGSNARGKYYQLTHDYLVPALREWLTRKQKETRRGRAEVCLAERAAEWNLRRDSRHLPSFWESLTIRRLTKRKHWTDTQRRMMRQAGRYYGIRAAALAVILSLVGWASYETNGRYQAATKVAGLLSAEIRDVPALLPELRPYFRWARPHLVDARRDSDPKKQLHASLALLPADASQREFLRQRLVDAGPEEGRIICRELKKFAGDQIVGGDQIEEFWGLVADATLDGKARFRAACALAFWNPHDRRWRSHAPEIAAWLVSENPLFVGQWIESLRPVAALLVTPLGDLYRRSEQQQVRANALLVLAEYHREDWRELLELSGDARRSELAIPASSLRRWASQVVPTLRAQLVQPFPAKTAETDKDGLAKRQANAGILLCLIGAAHEVWPSLTQADDPRIRTSLVHGFAPAGVDPALLVSRLTAEDDASVRRAILWSLGQYEASVLTRRRCDDLAPRLVEMLRNDPDAGLHSSAEWLLRKWGYEELLTSAETPLKQEPLRPDRNWYHTLQGHTLAIVRGPVRFRMGSPREDPDGRPEEPLRDEAIDWSFAITTKELSLRHYRRFAPEHLAGRGDVRSLEAPVGRVSLMNAMAYCRWLTQQEGLPDSEMCYVPAEDGSLQVAPDWLARQGYRLPTEAEWECACRAGTTTRRYFGHSHEYLASYAWYLGNSDGAAMPCGLLLPNDFGLFDMHGNVAEWCQNRYHAHGESAGDLRADDLWHTLRSSDYGGIPTTHRAAARASSSRIAQFESLGFRLARTIPKSMIDPQ